MYKRQDLSHRLLEEYHIHVVPLRIRCQDGEYADGVDITPADVYARLHAGELPKTSLPAGEDIEAVLRRVAAEGYDLSLIHIWCCPGAHSGRKRPA